MVLLLVLLPVLLGACRGPWRASWGHLGGHRSKEGVPLCWSLPLGHQNRLLGPSWDPLGALLGHSWALLGHSWALWGRSWGALGCSWAALGSLLGASWRSWVISWGSWALLGRLGALLGHSWGTPGTLFEHSGDSPATPNHQMGWPSNLQLGSAECAERSAAPACRARRARFSGLARLCCLRSSFSGLHSQFWLFFYLP